MRHFGVSGWGWVLGCVLLAGCGSEDGSSRSYIGPEGGTNASVDQRLRFEVPAGVFPEDTEVAIERIDETAPHGVGPAAFPGPTVGAPSPRERHLGSVCGKEVGPRGRTRPVPRRGA